MRRAAVVPMTPLLFADLAGADDPLADLRAEAVRAVRELSGPITALCPVGPGAPATYHHAGETAPLSHLVARHLCALAGLDEPTIGDPAGGDLLVVGDGSARHDPDGPGGFDPRAAAYDDELHRALAAGDGMALAALAERDDVDLLVSGGPAFRSLGRAMAQATGQVRWRGTPYGVTYLVAVWRGADADFSNPRGAV